MFRGKSFQSLGAMTYHLCEKRMKVEQEDKKRKGEMRNNEESKKFYILLIKNFAFVLS